MTAAVFLDRDGTVIVDKNYIRDPKDVELIPRAAEGIGLMNRLGFRVVLCSNQSGVARGMISMTELQAVHDRMIDLLSEHHAKIDAYYYCVHHAEGTVRPYAADCECRKPKPGLLQNAIRDHGLDPLRSFMVGDTLRDVKAGRAVGARTMLVMTGMTREIGTEEMANSDFIVYNLLEAARWMEATV